MSDDDIEVQEDYIQVEVERLESNEGTILVLSGAEAETGDFVLFVADHRPGRDIVEAIAAGEDPVTAAVPTWAVLSRARREA